MEEGSTAQMYCIRVRGHLDPRLSEWLEGLSIVAEQTEAGCPTVVLTGPLTDQAALRGVLTRLWDLNLDIISVNRIFRQGEET